MNVLRFEDLLSWQKSRELVLAIYALSVDVSKLLYGFIKALKKK